jgi:hypothetical protein
MPRNGDKVGYGKPPTHSQFQPGQSGNPAGRPKGLRNLQTDVKGTLKVPVTVREGGRPRKISTQEGILMVLREKALKGDTRAIERVCDLACRFNNDPVEPVAQELSRDDREILETFVKDVTADAVKSTPVERPRRVRVGARHKPKSSTNEESSK